MGRRRSKKGPEEAIVGLVVLSVLYLAATHRLVQAIGWIIAIGVLAVIVVVLAKLLRRPQELSRRSPPTPFGRREPLLRARTIDPPSQDRTPDVLDQIRDQRATEQQTLASTKPRAWSLALIRDLEWKRFEELCEGYWKAKGYRAELTGRGADGGIDINLYRPSDPDKLLAIIQCKSRSREPIGVAFVRELFGVMHHVKAPMGILVTSSGFHQPAREFAVGKHLQLIDGESLLKQLLELPAAAGDALLHHVTRGDYITPTCPSCDEKMVARTNKTDGTMFFGCRNFSRGCRQRFQPRTLPLG